MLNSRIVINTTPILSIIAAIGSLEILKELYQEVIVTKEVEEEILNDGQNDFGVKEFKNSNFLNIKKTYFDIPEYLIRNLDRGEASVIYCASANKIQLVAIDELIGRRLARLNKLEVTGSLGILIKAKKQGLISSLSSCINNMKKKDIWIGDEIILKALKEANE